MKYTLNNDYLLNIFKDKSILELEMEEKTLV